MTDTVDLLALCRIREVSWHFVARQAQRPDGLSELLAGRSSEQSVEAKASLATVADSLADLLHHRGTVAEMLMALHHEGVRVTTVLDDDYSVNLRLIYNLPPFLTYKGTLRAA